MQSLPSDHREIKSEKNCRTNIENPQLVEIKQHIINDQQVLKKKKKENNLG